MPLNRLLHNMFASLADKFAEAPAAPAPLRPAAPPPLVIAEPVNSLVDEQRLIAALNDQAACTAGRIQFVDVDEVRDRLGAEWLRLRPRILMAVEQQIRHHLTPTESLVCHREDVFLVLFDTDDPAVAHRRAAEIRQSINAFLLGQGVEELIRMVTSLSRVQDLARGPVQDLASLDRALDIEEAPAPTPTGPEPLDQEAAFRAILGELRFLYQPVLYVPKGLATSFRLLICRTPTGEPEGVGIAAYPRGASGQISNTLDLAALEAAARDMEAMMARGEKSIVCLPITWGSLSDRGRDRFVSALRALPEALRRYLVIEVFAMPPTVPDSRLSEVLSPVRGLVRAVSLVLAPKPGKRMARGGVGLSSLVVDFARVDWSDGPRALALLRRSVSDATAAALAPEAMNLNHPDLVQLAVRLGFQYVGGDGLEAPLHAPCNYYGITLPGGDSSAARTP